MQEDKIITDLHKIITLELAKRRKEVVIRHNMEVQRGGYNGYIRLRKFVE